MTIVSSARPSLVDVPSAQYHDVETASTDGTVGGGGGAPPPGAPRPRS
jgi:hypothetical protein